VGPKLHIFGVKIEGVDVEIGEIELQTSENKKKSR
jgi:hypothetical protein